MPAPPMRTRAPLKGSEGEGEGAVGKAGKEGEGCERWVGVRWARGV